MDPSQYSFGDNSLGTFDTGAVSPIADTNGGVDTSGASSIVPLSTQATAQQSTGSLLSGFESFLGAITPIATVVLQSTLAKPAASNVVGDGSKTATPVSGVPKTTAAASSTIGGIPTQTLILAGLALLGGLFLVQMNRARAAR